MSRPKGSKNRVTERTGCGGSICGNSMCSESCPTPFEYKASIKILGKFYEAFGSTVPEAIGNLKPDAKALGVTVLTLTKGAQSQERILPRIATRRLFAPSEMMREVGIKNTALRFSL